MIGLGPLVGAPARVHVPYYLLYLSSFVMSTVLPVYLIFIVYLLLIYLSIIYLFIYLFIECGRATICVNFRT